MAEEAKHMEEVKEILVKEKGFWESLGTLRVIMPALGILMLIPIILYVCYFNGGISSNHQHWSEFGDYIAGIAGILNVIMFVVLTITIHVSERKHAEKSTRYHAEEFIIQKIQMQLKSIDDLYIPFQQAVIENKDEEEAKSCANETFEVLQPFMTYLFYLKSLSFMPEMTTGKISELHSYLFDASDILLCYSLEIERKDGKLVETKDVLRVYREIYRYLAELEVIMTVDIAGFVMNKKEATNFREQENIDL